MGIVKEINKPSMRVFRRAYIKRRITNTGLFETSWKNITPYIEGWGNINNAIDSVRFNNFKFDAIDLIVNNNDGVFNPETYPDSLWNGFLTRYKTLIKIEAGYIDDAGTELPTLSTQGIYILSDEIPINSNNYQCILSCKSLISIFDEVLAKDVTGLGPTQTASELITRFRDHTDGTGARIFSDFITTTSWNIQTTTSYYNLATSTTYLNDTCWEVMNKLAECEGFVLKISRDGQFYFTDRNENTTTSLLNLYGSGFPEQNIISIEGYKEAINKFYNYFILEYTTDSYVFGGTTTSVNPNNSTWKYGARSYQFSNNFFSNTATAQLIVNNLYTEFNEIKEEATIKCKFIPHIEILDKVNVNYISYNMANVPLYDQCNYDEVDFADESGDVINLENVEFKVLSKNTNLDEFTTTLQLRRL